MSARLGGILEALTPIPFPLPPGLPEDPGPLDEIDALAQRTDALCAPAVDPWEIAAGLEAEGINDAVAAATYGQPDIFALAEELYRRVPRRVVASAPAPNPWRSAASHHVLRGALFGLPGLCYVAASHSMAAPGAVAVTVLALLLSWSASEALSFLGYVRIGHRDRPGAARVLRRGAVLSAAVLLPVTVATGVALGAGPVGVAFASAQALYLLAATVVLVSGGERRLLAALVPGVVGSTFYLVAGGPVLVVWVTGGATVAATLGLAAWLTRGASTVALSRVAVRGAVPHAGFGLVAGGLLTFTTIAALVGPVAVRGPMLAGALVTLPLSLSMGVAEWLLYQYRRQVHDIVVAATSLAQFSRRARAALAGSVVVYLVTLALIADTLAWLGHRTGAFTMTPSLFWTAVALGGALFVALALRSCGVVGPALSMCAAALVTEAALWWFTGGDNVQTIQLGTCVALFAALLPYALVVLGRATRHR